MAPKDRATCSENRELPNTGIEVRSCSHRGHAVTELGRAVWDEHLVRRDHCLPANRSEIEQNRKVVADAAGKDKQVPDAMAPATDVIQDVEDHADGVEETACHQ